MGGDKLVLMDADIPNDPFLFYSCITIIFSAYCIFFSACIRVNVLSTQLIPNKPWALWIRFRMDDTTLGLYSAVYSVDIVGIQCNIQPRKQNEAKIRGIQAPRRSFPSKHRHFG